jgi:NAD dependent epimerase/dehydratase family enzyme
MTSDSRVVPKRLLDKGFEFIYPTIETAIAAYHEKK